MSADSVRAEFAAGRMRPEWSWVAESDDGVLVGHALGWGRSDSERPLALDVVDVLGAVVEDQAEVGAMLLREARARLRAAGVPALPEYTLRLPTGWRTRPTTDLTNTPMVAAFGRCGYDNTEVRIVLEPSSR